MSPGIEKSVHCVLFDAVGTLIHAEPSVAVAYQSISSRYGADLSVETIRQRFRQTMSDRPPGSRTNELSEREFWRSTVREVIGNVADPEGCFEELYEHFASPANWRVAEHSLHALTLLEQHGVATYIASNFDARLRLVLLGKPELAAIRRTFISAEIGWRKPHVNFYNAILQEVAVAPAQILMVGDDFDLDIVPARELGMQALHLTAASSPETVSGTIPTLWHLLSYCGIYDEFP